MLRFRLFVMASAILGGLAALLLVEGAIRLLWWNRARVALARMAEIRTTESIETGPGNMAEGVRTSVFPDIVYELRPNLRGTYDGKRYASDRFGFRGDRSIELDKPKGVRRIIGIGDSTMWGSGVDNGETYLDRLDVALRAEGFPVETVNTAVWGYNAVQEVATLARKGLRLSPDIVVVGLCANDRDYPYFIDADSYLSTSGSALARILGKAVRSAGFGSSEEVPQSGTLMPFSEFMRAYEELASLARRSGFDVVVFGDCVREPPHQNRCALGTNEEWHRFVDAMLGWGFRLCSWDPVQIPVNQIWHHASAQGHRILADKLAACVRPILKEALAR